MRYKNFDSFPSSSHLLVIMSPTASRIFVTTTLWDTPTSAVTYTNSGTSIPVGAIAGGIVGGASIAIAVVITWIIWGRSISRAQRKQEKELVSFNLLLANKLTDTK